MMLTVNPHRPHTPPNHAHHGSWENNCLSISIPPFSHKVTMKRKTVPMKKDTNDAMKGETTDCRKREFAAVCIGVKTPRRNIGIKLIIKLKKIRN